MSRESIWSEITQERDAQDTVHGGPYLDDQHHANDWIAILSRALGLAASDEATVDAVRWRRQMVRLAATAVAAIESHDRLTGRQVVAGEFEKGSGF